MPEFDLIIPVAKQDLNTALANIRYIQDNLKPSKIVIITAEEVRRTFDKCASGDRDVVIIDESSMIPNLTFHNVKKYMDKRGAGKRTGWYFQQFLKMAYAFICDKEYYMSWDADTIPIRNHSMFEGDIPLFCTKKEYNKPYFDTLKKMLGMDKVIEDSFIAEHMMFNKQVMLELIQDLTKCGNKLWFYNILDSIADDALGQAGFSEFETYGTYAVTKYPNMYRFREVSAIRNAKRIFDVCPKHEVVHWLAKDYDTLSFEKWDKHIVHNSIYNNALFRTVCPPHVYIKICYGIIKLRHKLSGEDK